MSTKLIKQLLFAAATCFVAASFAQGDVENVQIVVFDAQLVDTSTEGEMFGTNAAETKRLAMISDQLRAGLHMSERYEVLDMEPAQSALATLSDSVRFFHDCNNCELDIAKSLGAQQSAVVWVQKVSNLILNLNVVIKDVATGKIVKTSFVDIRGNTDRSWQHGTKYMLKNRLLAGADLR